jgi:prepilin-type N-terminal cleavage/methylation domain-containing protein
MAKWLYCYIVFILRYALCDMRCVIRVMRCAIRDVRYVMCDARKKSKGFTLAETMISVAIVVIMSGMYFVNYKGYERRSNINFATQKVASDIRTAQNDALSQKKFGAQPPYGWGAYFNTANSNQYIIFADMDDNKTRTDSSEDERIVALPGGITLTGIEVGGSSVNTLNILFQSPDPTTWINGANNARATTTFNGLKTVHINFLGLIEAN